MDFLNFLYKLGDFLVEVFANLYHDPLEQKPENLTMNQPVSIAPKYLWDTKDNVRHSVRLIADEEGLTVEQKNTLCATIQCESNFNTKAICRNKKNGKVVSSDYGVCQWNDVYHGKEITPDEALNNPEKAVRLMCAYWKRGQQNLWVCFSRGIYRQYL